jgi:hypothetical protein
VIFLYLINSYEQVFHNLCNIPTNIVTYTGVRKIRVEKNGRKAQTNILVVPSV